MITVAVEIDASPSRVWEVIEPIEHHVDWMRDAVAIEFHGAQRRGVGTRFRCDTKVGPITLADEMEITGWVPEFSMSVRHSGIVTGEGMFTLTPIDRGRRTRFSWTEQLTFPWWLGSRVGSLLGGNVVMKAIWRRNLGALKAIVET